MSKDLVHWTEEALATSQREGDSAVGERCAALVQGALLGKGIQAAEAVVVLEEELESAYDGYLPDCVTALHRGLGQLAARRLKLSAALDHYAAARYVASRQGRVSTWLVTHLDLAVLYFRMGRLDESLTMIDQGLPWFAALETQEIWHEASARSLKGRILVQLGNSSEGITELNRALELRRLLEADRDPDRPSYLIVGLNALGRAYLEAGRLREALPILTQVVELAQEWPLHRANGLNELADYHLLRGDPVAAQKCLDQVDHLAKEENLHDINVRLQASFLRARAQAALGDKGQAIETLSSVVAGFEALRGQGEELYAPFFAQRRFYLDQLIRWMVEEGRAAESFELAEFVRARGLLDALMWPPTRIFQAASEAQANRAVVLQERLSELVRSDDSGREIQAARDALWALDGEMRRAAGATVAEPIGLDAARQLLREGDLLVVYWLGEESSSLWLLAGPRAEVRQVSLAEPDQIEGAVKQLLHFIAEGSPGRRGARRELATLGAALLGPTREELATARTVIVVADGALASVPFAALPDPADGEPLIRHHAVASIHSLSVLAAIRQRDRTAPAQKLLTAFADPTYLETSSADRPPLPASGEAAEVIVGLVDETDAGPARLYLGREASRREVLAGAASSSRLVHFGAHVELNPTYPEFSALHLSEIDSRGQPVDGALRLQDLGRLDLSAEVVTLAGCSTAVGRLVGTEGPMAFPRGFLFAGADAVVASLWRVRDEPTAQLMIRFYRGLLSDGLPVAEALRQAQLALLDGDWPELEHWAGFVLLGEWVNSPNTDRNQPFPGSGVYPR